MKKQKLPYDVLLYVESRYKINRKRVRMIVRDILTKHQVSGPAEVSIAVVGDRKMRDISRKYKGDDKTRNILSFPLSEGPSSYLPSDKLRLGDIILSYPELIRDAAREDMLVDDRVDELLEHGLLHLLGLHHE